MAGLRILIVDDEPLVSDLIRRKLSKMEPGFGISVVVSGQDCLDYLRDNTVDCILSDYQMPGMDGMELLARIREAGDETPFIFVTGQGSEDIAREAFKNGAYDYFTKEIGFAHFDRIANSIRQAVNQRIVRESRERAEDALRRSEDNYRLLFESNPQPMMVFDNAALSILAVNDAAVSHYGYSREEFLSMTIKDIRPPEDVPLLMDALGDQPAGIDKAGVFRHLKKDGAIIKVEITSHPIEFEGRKATAALVEDVTERARFELERQHELDTLISILENLGDPVYACDLETYEIIYANRALRDISDGGLVGRPCHAALQGTDEPCEFCTNAMIIGSKGTANRREQYMPGLDRLFELTESAIDWPDGRVVRLVQARDITGRNRSEQEILRLSRQNRLMLESAGEGIYGLDLEGKATFINRAALEMTGWTLEDMANMRQHDLVHHSRPDGSPYPVEDCPIYDAFKTGAPHTVTDEVFWRKDGTSFPVEYTSTPIIEGGVIIGAVVVFRDITERKTAEEALKKAEVFYKEAEAITKIGNWQWLADKDEVVWSDGMFTIFGTTREEFGGTYQAYLDLVHPDDLERVVAEVGRSITAGEPLDYQTRIVCPDGTEKVIQAYGTVSLDADSRPVKIFGTVQDITGRRALEKQRDELFAMIRHDFKTPLTVISGNAEMLMLENGPNLGRESCKMLEAVKTSAQSLSRMLDDLAEISRLETLSLGVNKTPVDVTDMLLEASFIASERAATSGITYARELPDGLPTALISRSYVQRAVTNMLDNALKYTPPGGCVRLGAAVTDGEGGRSLEISVSDTGPGIPEDEHGIVFEKYYRSRRTQHKAGSGLGLAIVKAVASVHGGSVELTSREGHGSTFTLRLPLDG